MGELLEVQEHGGRFGVDELARFSLKAAAIVYLLGIDSISTEGDLPVAHSSRRFLRHERYAETKAHESCYPQSARRSRRLTSYSAGFDDGVHIGDPIKGINLYVSKGTHEKAFRLWRFSDAGRRYSTH